MASSNTGLAQGLTRGTASVGYSGMPISLSELPTLTSEQEQALRAAGKLVLKALRDPPGQAYTPQEIIPTILQRAGVSHEVRTILAVAGLVLDVAALDHPDVARVNSTWRWIVDALLNTLVRDGALEVIIHKGTTYLHARPEAPELPA